MRGVNRSGGQGIELVSGGRNLAVGAVQLPLLDHVHGLDVGEDAGA